VWLGLGSMVLSGVSVGDGAVVGAGAVVAKPVPPYAIVVGNPARIVRYRFEADIRNRLCRLRWWELSDAELFDARQLFLTNIETFLREMERRHPATPRRVSNGAVALASGGATASSRGGEGG